MFKHHDRYIATSGDAIFVHRLVTNQHFVLHADLYSRSQPLTGRVLLGFLFGRDFSDHFACPFPCEHFATRLVSSSRCNLNVKCRKLGRTGRARL